MNKNSQKVFEDSRKAEHPGLKLQHVDLPDLADRLLI
jgi:hypothetical protein